MTTTAKWTDTALAALFAKARAAGLAAGEAMTPTPMVVRQHASPLDDASPVTKSWFVSEGPCGFAWITLRPGTSPAARFAKKALGARKGYHGGMEIWVGEFGQSIARKEAFARAFADVLTEAGFTAYAGSRMD